MSGEKGSSLFLTVNNRTIQIIDAFPEASICFQPCEARWTSPFWVFFKSSGWTSYNAHTAVDVPHASRNVPGRCLQKKMIKIWHQAIGWYSDVPHLLGLIKQRDKNLEVFFSGKDHFRPSDPVHDMIPCLRICDSQRSLHGLILYQAITTTVKGRPLYLIEWQLNILIKVWPHFLLSTVSRNLNKKVYN